ncbi:ATP-binding protein (macronuclear) [Tetrahymena thermophila SB210]|uniref:GPN-loop GTPase 2 n=1 Tax=Tetrahymena thermophila (strain SB210) TaxID=312017 RepID=Q22F18_TETTS|nr:ATP-binding protein [Tetrahymena thermophila SB210]EAR83857.2 ATP-binding protein [Tetrahymena thermophila SB210]|eukprot:XP_001031520.2 ATP-binding protein [Tetrahymena thermophila SB210]
MSKDSNQQKTQNQEFKLEDVPNLLEFYGALVIGPSGSGKTTLCTGLQQFYKLLERDHAIINLDPANETMKYQYAVDIKDLINLEDVMEELNLGPNGGLIYCMKFIEDNIDWLKERIAKLKGKYLIFDLPGQIELYMASDHVKNIIEKLKKNDIFEAEFTIVELFDSTYCYDYSNYVSLTLQALVSYLNLEMPHINVLSKIDLMKEYGKPKMSLDHYLDGYGVSLAYKYDSISYKKSLSNFEKKNYRLDRRLARLIDEFKLISFIPLSIENKLLVSSLVYQIDKSNGFQYSEQYNQERFQQIRADIAETSQVYSVNERVLLENELFGDQEKNIDWAKEFSKPMYKEQELDENKSDEQNQILEDGVNQDDNDDGSLYDEVDDDDYFY